MMIIKQTIAILKTVQSGSQNAALAKDNLMMHLMLEHNVATTIATLREENSEIAWIIAIEGADNYDCIPAEEIMKICEEIKNQAYITAAMKVEKLNEKQRVILMELLVGPLIKHTISKIDASRVYVFNGIHQRRLLLDGMEIDLIGRRPLLLKERIVRGTHASILSCITAPNPSSKEGDPVLFQLIIENKTDIEKLLQEPFTDYAGYASYCAEHFAQPAEERLYDLLMEHIIPAELLAFIFESVPEELWTELAQANA